MENWDLYERDQHFHLHQRLSSGGAIHSTRTLNPGPMQQGVKKLLSGQKGSLLPIECQRPTIPYGQPVKKPSAVLNIMSIFPSSPSGT